MAFCGNCGAQMEDGARFCPSCGTSFSPAAEAVTAQQPERGTKLQELNDTADTTAQFDAQDIANGKVMAVLSYLGLLVLIPLFAGKGSKFARFHTNQGLTLFLTEIAYSIVYNILSWILHAIHLGFVANIISIVSLVFLVLAIIGIINAAKGRAKELPIIGAIRILK